MNPSRDATASKGSPSRSENGERRDRVVERGNGVTESALPCIAKAGTSRETTSALPSHTLRSGRRYEDRSIATRKRARDGDLSPTTSRQGERVDARTGPGHRRGRGREGREKDERVNEIPGVLAN